MADSSSEPELPNYRTLRELGAGSGVSAVIINASLWPAQPSPEAFVAAIDGGVTLFECSEVSLPALAGYLVQWATSDAAALPGAKTPSLALRVKVEATSANPGEAVGDALAAASVRTSGASAAVAVLVLELPSDLTTPEALRGVAAAVDKANLDGFCPLNVGIAGVRSPEGVKAFADALVQCKLATWSVPYGVASPSADADKTLEACVNEGVTMVSESPFRGLAGAGADPNMFKLLELVGAMVGGKTAAQIALGYPIARGAAVRADVTADDGRGAWEAAGAMSVSLGDEEMRVLEEKARASS